MSVMDLTIYNFENCTLSIYLNSLESLNFITTRKSLAISLYRFSNTLKLNTQALDIQPGSAVAVRYSSKNV
jgi:hypothetical protein